MNSFSKKDIILEDFRNVLSGTHIDLLNEAMFMDKLQENKVYKMKVQLPKAKENKLKNSLIIAVTPNLKSTIELINSETALINTVYSGYLFNWFIREKFSNNKMRKIRFKWQDRWLNIRNNCSKITRTFKEYERFKDYNLFFDMSDWNILFFQNLHTNKIRNIERYIDLLKRLSNPDVYYKHTNIHLAIPVNDWLDNKNIKNNKGFTDFRRLNNPITYLSWVLKRKPELISDLPNIIFYTDSSWFIFNHSKIEKEKLFTEFMKFCKRLSPNLEEVLNTQNNTEINEEQNLEFAKHEELPNDVFSDEVEKVFEDTPSELVSDLEKNSNMDFEKSEINITDTRDKELDFTNREKLMNFNNIKDDKNIIIQDTQDINTDNIIKNNNVNDKEINKAMASSLKDTITFKLNHIETLNDNIPESENEDNDIEDGEINEENSNEKELEEAIEKSLENSESENEDEILNEINNDEKIIRIVNKLKADKLEASPARLARENMLREKFSSSSFNNKTVKDILKHNEEIKIVPKKIKANVLDTNLTENTFEGFEDTYVKNQRDVDLVKISNFFSESKIPMIPLNVEIKDNSDDFNIMEQLVIDLEDRKGKRHHIKLNLPKVENGQMYISGSQKSLLKQIILKPIVKTDPDTVQITTNYNKLFMYRVGKNLSIRITKIIELIRQSKDKIDYETGDFTKFNKAYISTLFFDEFAKVFYTIKTKKHHFIFNLKENEERMKNLPLKEKIPPKSSTCNLIGQSLNGDYYIFYDPLNDKIYEGDILSEHNFLEYIYHSIEDVLGTDFIKRKVPLGSNKLVHSQVKIMNKDVPVVLLCLFSLGLLDTLQRAKIEYRFVEGSSKGLTLDETTEDYIEFKDSCLVYKTTPLENAMLLNGLKYVPTYNYTVEEFGETRTYIEIFEEMFDRGNIALAFENFAELMIDSITKDILEDLNLPNNYIDVLLYSNALLVDNSYQDETDFNVCRLKSANEIVTSIVYSIISNAYSNYKLTATNNNPIPMTVKPDAVISELMALKTTEEYSELSPIHEVERNRSVSYKGFRGKNLEQSYTLPKRCMTKSMIGTIAMSTPPSGKTGTVKQLCTDANIVSTRGYFKPPLDINSLSTKNLISPSEGLVPFSTNHDDPPRINMLTAQQNHLVPVYESEVFPISNGVDKIMADLVSDKFCFKAKNSGTVIDINEKDGLMTVEYDDGQQETLSIKSTPIKNSSGGFYLSNELEVQKKVGDKFKARDILASNSAFFKKDIFGNPTFTSMVMANVGLMTAGNTYEDSCIITEELARKLGTDVIMKKSIIFEPTTNVLQMVEENDTILVGEPLITFEENPTDDEEMGEILNTIGQSLGDDAESLGKTILKSSYGGVIDTIKIYYSCPDEELSESLQKIIKKYNTKVKRINSQITKTNKTNSIATRSMIIENSQVTPDKNGKVKGETMPNHVMIEFYIKYKDIVAIGDKVTLYTALKGIVSEVIPDGQELTSVDNPDKKIDLLLSHISVDARMTTSLLISGFLNKVIIGLKSEMKKIWEE